MRWPGPCTGGQFRRRPAHRRSVALHPASAWAALRVPTFHPAPVCAALSAVAPQRQPAQHRVPSRRNASLGGTECAYLAPSASLHSTERAYLPPNASLHSTECRRATAPAWAALRVPTLHPARAWVALGAVAPRLRLRGRSGATACRRNLLARGAVPALSALAGPNTLADHQRRGRCPYRPSPSTLVRCRSPVARPAHRRSVTSHPAPAWAALGAVAPRLRLRGRSGATACRRNFWPAVRSPHCVPWQGPAPSPTTSAAAGVLTGRARAPSSGAGVRSRFELSHRARPAPPSAPAAGVRPRLRGQPSQSLVE